MSLRDRQIEAIRQVLGPPGDAGTWPVDLGVLGDLVDAVMRQAMRRHGGETSQQFHVRREQISIERGRVEDPIRNRLAGVMHDTDCGWNCSGHGLLQERIDARYGRLADVALRVLAEHDRLVPAAPCPEPAVDDIGFPDATACEVFGMPGGWALRVHPITECAGRACCIHNPSGHHMRDWPLNWRADRGLMERTCRHGVGHPDPDDIAYKARTRGEEYAQCEAVHGCDLCCSATAPGREMGIGG